MEMIISSILILLFGLGYVWLGRRGERDHKHSH